MFGIGFGEIVVIFVILIIFIRPDDLPKFLRTAGKLYGKVKKMYNEIMKVKDKIIEEIDETATMDEAPSTTSKSPSKTIPEKPTVTVLPAKSDDLRKQEDEQLAAVETENLPGSNENP